MNKLLLFSIVLVLFQSCSHGKLNIEILESPDQQYYLSQVKGERLIRLDSTVSKNEKLTFQLKSYDPGMYHIGTNRAGLIFILNEQNVKLKTTWPALQDNLQVVKSFENDNWFQYIKLRDESYHRLKLLSPILSIYNNNEEFYQVTLNEYLSVQDQLFDWVDKTVKEQNELLSSHFIIADMKPEVPAEWTINDQQEFLKMHYFDHVDWQDTLLINSNVLTNKISEYLNLLYTNPNMSGGELQQVLSYAVDQILPLSRENDQMYAFCLDYFITGFKLYDFDGVLLHIAGNYEPPGR